MVDVPDDLRALFHTSLDHEDGRFLIEVPRSEIDHGTLDADRTYRVAVFPSDDTPPPDTATEGTASRGPPVETGERREVTIETTGDQGDGIAKVERGYVVIVPEADPGETVTVEIESVRPNVAFATVREGSAGE
jgi:predicted RNA-binding protein with TRAM domain